MICLQLPGEMKILNYDKKKKKIVVRTAFSAQVDFNRNQEDDPTYSSV